MAKKAANGVSTAPLSKRIVKNRELYILMIPVVIYFLLFHYKPMFGLIIAFQDFKPRLGYFESPWVGLQHFVNFFTGPYFASRMWNTLKISLSTLVIGFPAPILFALLMNELRGKLFPRVVQTVTYLPHFISMVVVCAMIKEFTESGGFINVIATQFGYDGRSMLNVSELFVPIYVISNVWQGIGWGSIVYLAALTGIDMQLYEAARIDGAGRWKQTLHVTIPGILPTIVTMFIMRCGQIMSVGHEKILLLMNETTQETADVISTFVYRMVFVNTNPQYSYSAAVGLFNSVANFVLVIIANTVSRKLSDTSLW
ncbi:MAG TPA: sugar ABC transporter permease [Candidatus Faecimorpha stercoravium]|nr:sugar ABC transporter permease [Candidatus Faecimorpha stercoravium]